MFLNNTGIITTLPRNNYESNEEYYYRCNLYIKDKKNSYNRYELGKAYHMIYTIDTNSLIDITTSSYISTCMRNPEYNKIFRDYVQELIPNVNLDKLTYLIGINRLDIEVMEHIRDIMGIISYQVPNLNPILSKFPHVEIKKKTYISRWNSMITENTDLIYLDKIIHTYNDYSILYTYIDNLSPGGLLIINTIDYTPGIDTYTNAVDIINIILSGNSITRFTSCIKTRMQLYNDIQLENMVYMGHTIVGNSYNLVFRKNSIHKTYILEYIYNSKTIIDNIFPSIRDVSLIKDIHYNDKFLQYMHNRDESIKIMNIISNWVKSNIGSYTIYDAQGKFGTSLIGIIGDKYSQKQISYINIYEENGTYSKYINAIAAIYMTPNKSSYTYMGKGVNIFNRVFSHETLEFLRTKFMATYEKSVVFMHPSSNSDEEISKLLSMGVGFICIYVPKDYETNIKYTHTHEFTNNKLLGLYNPIYLKQTYNEGQRRCAHEIRRYEYISEIRSQYPDINHYIYKCILAGDILDPVLVYRKDPIMIEVKPTILDGINTYASLKNIWDTIKKEYPSYKDDIDIVSLIDRRDNLARNTFDTLLPLIHKLVNKHKSLVPATKLNDIFKVYYDKFIASKDKMDNICIVLILSDVVEVKAKWNKLTLKFNIGSTNIEFMRSIYIGDSFEYDLAALLIRYHTLQLDKYKDNISTAEYKLHSYSGRIGIHMIGTKDNNNFGFNIDIESFFGAKNISLITKDGNYYIYAPIEEFNRKINTLL